MFVIIYVREIEMLMGGIIYEVVKVIFFVVWDLFKEYFS